MRGQKNKRGSNAIWGSDLNLSLQWTYQEYGGGERGIWSVASGLLWNIRPQKLVASVTVYNSEYILHPLSREGLSEGIRAEVESHLKILNLFRARHDRFQD